jgi:hypothetical protein
MCNLPESNIFSGSASCRLMYASASVAMQPISPSNLFSGSAHASGSPFELYVSPTVLCASTSLITAQPQLPSIWTAGSLVFMTVTARDMYGNWKTKPDAETSQLFVTSRLLDFSGPLTPGVVQSLQFPMTFSVSLRPLLAGLRSTDASFVLISAAGRGMHATYYR